MHRLSNEPTSASVSAESDLHRQVVVCLNLKKQKSLDSIGVKSWLANKGITIQGILFVISQ